MTPTHASIALSGLLLGLAACVKAASSDEPATEAPAVACSLSSPEIRERLAKVRGELLPTVLEVVDLPDGYELVVPRSDDQLQKLAELVDLESRCCAFLDFSIRLRSGSKILSLVMTGPEGTREVLAEMVDRRRDPGE